MSNDLIAVPCQLMCTLQVFFSSFREYRSIGFAADSVVFSGSTFWRRLCLYQILF